MMSRAQTMILVRQSEQNARVMRTMIRTSVCWMENGSPALQAAGRASAHISGFGGDLM